MRTNQANQKRKLICHIIFRLDFGGLENGLVNLINGLPADEFRHAIVCLTHSTDFRKRIRQPDVEIFDIHKRPGKDPSAYVRVWRLLRRLKPDIVHTRNLPALDMLAPAALAGVRRLIHSEHGLDISELSGRNRKYNWLRRLSSLLVNRYVCVSNDLANWLARDIHIPSTKISKIYNGVDTDLFTPQSHPPKVLPAGFAPDNAFVIGTIGRLESVKDQVTLVRGFLHILDVRPQLRDVIRLVLVGDGVLREEIETLLAEHGARELAWLPGFRREVAAVYQSLDVFVLPSRREGISNTLLEAMASGLPVVATKVGGNPEVVVEENTGLLVPPGDSLAMSDALLRYIDAPDLAAKHAAAGRERALKKFSLASMFEGYGRVYRSLA